MKKGSKNKTEDLIGLVGEKLKELRIRAGYSSYENFAHDKELDRKQYWRMENGANLTLSSLIKILQIHNISLKEFFNEKFFN